MDKNVIIIKGNIECLFSYVLQRWSPLSLSRVLPSVLQLMTASEKPSHTEAAANQIPKDISTCVFCDVFRVQNSPLFLSMWEYGAIICMTAASTILHCHTVYPSYLRFIKSSAVRSHHCELYALLSWPSPSLRRQQYWLTFIY